MRFSELARITVAAALLTIGFAATAAPGSPATGKEASANLVRLRAKQSRLLDEVRTEILRLREHETPSAPPALTERRRELESLLREIEYNIALENDPRTKFIELGRNGNPFGKYYSRLMLRIESAGRDDFPKKDGRPIYGKGRLKLVVLAGGTIEYAAVSSSSGIPEIDDHILNLVKGLAPLEQFDEAMRKRADRIVIDSDFNFLNEDRPSPASRSSPACPDHADSFRAAGFPKEASAAGLTHGAATVEFTLNPDGSISDPVVLSSTDPSFDRETLARTRALKCIGGERAARMRFAVNYRK